MTQYKKGVFSQTLSCTGTVTQGAEVGATEEITLLSDLSFQQSICKKSAKKYTQEAALYLKSTPPVETKSPSTASVFLGKVTMKDSKINFTKTLTFSEEGQKNKLIYSFAVDLNNKTASLQQSNPEEETITTILTCSFSDCF